MKALTAMMVVLAVGALFWHLNQEDKDRAAREASEKSALAEQAAKAAEARKEADAAAKHQEEIQDLRREIAEEPHVRLDAKIIQHLGEGRLLVEAVYVMKGAIPYGTFELMGYPEADSLADGEYIQCTVAAVGTYSYVATDGGSSTVRRLVDVDNPQVAGTPAPTPKGSWMWQDGTALDRGAYDQR